MLDVKIFIFTIIGFFWGGLTAPVSIRLAGLYNIIDIPDERKLHHNMTPRGAGLGLWVGYMLMAVIMSGSMPELKYIATGAAIIFLCGYLDDMCSLSPFLRLGLHIFAAVLAVFPLKMNFLVSVVAVIWVAGVTSAYNLIDGMNGLCISIFIASSVAIFFMGYSYPGIYMGAMALGVLCWNFPSAQTFLGDGGSTLMGYLFASHFLNITAFYLHNMDLHEAIILLLFFGGVPVVDTLTAFTRRILTGKSPFYPDKKHLHHLLISLTGSNIFTVSIILSLQVIMLVAGLQLFIQLT